ncbi:MAG: protein NrfC [Psychromonas sp.]|jgi:protein NrfC
MEHSKRKFIVGGFALLATSGLTITRMMDTTETGEKCYAMIHDESKCIGCGACVDACREDNNAPQGVTRLKIKRSDAREIDGKVHYSFFRQSCQNSANAPCVMVCPTGESFRDPLTAIVDVDKERCIGCQ